jgi:hypothetical protein
VVFLAACSHHPTPHLDLQRRPPQARATGLGEEVWGLGTVSVASARELPEHKAEMGTQVLLGEVVRVLGRNTNGLWYDVQTEDGYRAWLEKGSFVRCSQEQVRQWQRSPLLVVTAFEEQILEQPWAEAQPVSDVVIADLLRKRGERGNWYEVELPDGRAGFLPRSAATDYLAWRQQRQATAENIERTARRFLGRPYLWGGNSPKGLDCSGFTKLVFYLNGVDLNRNASQQARQGKAIPLDKDFKELRKGDLLFFGWRSKGDQPERVFHVGIYLGDKLFIHSSERVRINSLDPQSPIRDEHRFRSLLGARRVLPEK